MSFPNSPDKQEVLLNHVRATVGDPIVRLVDREEDALTNALRNGLLDYWTALPHQYQSTVDITSFNTSVYQQTISGITTSAFKNQTPEVQSTMYYLGICRTSVMSRAIQYSNLDAYLLNVPFGTPPRMGAGGFGSDVVTGPLDVRKMVLEVSEQAWLTGVPEINQDTINYKISYNVPVFFGQLTIWHGFGSTDTTLTFVPWNHMRVLSNIISVKFLDTIIAARQDVQLNSDHRMDQSYLITRRDNIQERLDTELAAIQFVPISWT